MKVTVEIADSDLSDVFALTGERKKGPAIRLLMEQALQLRRRQRIVERFLSGEWGVELAGYEEARELERQRLHGAVD